MAPPALRGGPPAPPTVNGKSFPLPPLMYAPDEVLPPNLMRTKNWIQRQSETVHDEPNALPSTSPEYESKSPAFSPTEEKQPDPIHSEIKAPPPPVEPPAPIPLPDLPAKPRKERREHGHRRRHRHHHHKKSNQSSPADASSKSNALPISPAKPVAPVLSIPRKTSATPLVPDQGPQPTAPPTPPLPPVVEPPPAVFPTPIVTPNMQSLGSSMPPLNPNLPSRPLSYANVSPPYRPVSFAEDVPSASRMSLMKPFSKKSSPGESTSSTMTKTANLAKKLFGNKSSVFDSNKSNDSRSTSIPNTMPVVIPIQPVPEGPVDARLPTPPPITPEVEKTPDQLFSSQTVDKFAQPIPPIEDKSKKPPTRTNSFNTDKNLPMTPIAAMPDAVLPKVVERKVAPPQRPKIITDRIEPRELPREVPREMLREVPRELPREVLRDQLREPPRELLQDMPREQLRYERQAPRPFADYYRPRDPPRQPEPKPKLPSPEFTIGPGGERQYRLRYSKKPTRYGPSDPNYEDLSSVGTARGISPTKPVVVESQNQNGATANGSNSTTGFKAFLRSFTGFLRKGTSGNRLPGNRLRRLSKSTPAEPQAPEQIEDAGQGDGDNESDGGLALDDVLALNPRARTKRIEETHEADGRLRRRSFDEASTVVSQNRRVEHDPSRLKRRSFQQDERLVDDIVERSSRHGGVPSSQRSFIVHPRNSHGQVQLPVLGVTSPGGHDAPISPARKAAELKKIQRELLGHTHRPDIFANGSVQSAQFHPEHPRSSSVSPPKRFILASSTNSRRSVDDDEMSAAQERHGINPFMFADREDEKVLGDAPFVKLPYSKRRDSYNRPLTSVRDEIQAQAEALASNDYHHAQALRQSSPPVQHVEVVDLTRDDDAAFNSLQYALPSNEATFSNQCHGFNRSTGKRCTRMVKTRLPNGESVQLAPDMPVYCHNHKREMLDTLACVVPGSTNAVAWVRFNDWINPELTDETKILLRLEMEKPVSEKDEPGIIYAFQLVDADTESDYSLFKIGRSTNPSRRMQSIANKCHLTPRLIEQFPDSASSDSRVLMHSMSRSMGKSLLDRVNSRIANPSPNEDVKCRFSHRIERLIHIELRDRFRNPPEICAGCGLVHREWFKVPHADGRRKGWVVGEEWIDVRNVIVTWVRFGEDVYGKA